MSLTSGKESIILHHIVFFILLLLLIGSLPVESTAVVYEWVDANGIVHISDNPPDIPAAGRKNLRIIKEDNARSNEISIPFERTPSGLIIVSVVLNDHISTKLIFDTGADTVVITENFARKLKQDTIGTGEEVTLHTSCGNVSGHVFRMKKIDLGAVSKSNVRSIIVPIAASSLNGYDGLLGLSFLENFKITVDYKKGRIIIGKEE